VTPTRVLLLSDTHIPDFAAVLPDALRPELHRADLILHAGDVTAATLLDELSTLAPVHVAIGNGDGPDVRAWGALPEVELDVHGVRIAVVHDAGPRKGRERRLRRRFPRADVVVFGHSHIPLDVSGIGQRLFNPGSPTWKRRQPWPTYGVLTIADGDFRTAIHEIRP
jgi:putative phosphoesterase